MTIPTAIHPRKPAMGGCSARVQRGKGKEGDRGSAADLSRSGLGHEQSEKKLGLHKSASRQG